MHKDYDAIHTQDALPAEDKRDYKSLYELALKDYHDLCDQTEKDIHELEHLQIENENLRKTLKKYEAIIHTVEAFVGQKLIGNEGDTV